MFCINQQQFLFNFVSQKFRSSLGSINLSLLLLCADTQENLSVCVCVSFGQGADLSSG